MKRYEKWIRELLKFFSILQWRVKRTQNFPILRPPHPFPQRCVFGGEMVNGQLHFPLENSKGEDFSLVQGSGRPLPPRSANGFKTQFNKDDKGPKWLSSWALHMSYELLWIEENKVSHFII